MARRKGRTWVASLQHRHWSSLKRSLVFIAFFIPIFVTLLTRELIKSNQISRSHSALLSASNPIPAFNLLVGGGPVQDSDSQDGSNTQQLIEISQLPVDDRQLDDNIRLCTRQQIQRGRWVAINTIKPPYVSKTKHLRCYPSHVYKESPWRTWDWQPNDRSCTLLRWNSAFFCSMLWHTRISIIGDSLSWEQYSSLLQLLKQRVHQNDQHVSKIEDRNHIQMACHNHTSIVWRNDARLKRMSHSIQQDFPDVLILNRGAHYTPDEELMDDISTLIVQLNDWQNQCRRKQRQCYLFWRTTVPGHAHCANFTVPTDDMEAMEAYVMNLDNYDNVTIHYHWYDFDRQNKLILQALHNSGLPLQVLDAYHLNVLRPDDHRVHQNDCLHNCYPGKMDVYNQLLLHFLAMERARSYVTPSSTRV